jgi:hypothetical protein
VTSIPAFYCIIMEKILFPSSSASARFAWSTCTSLQSHSICKVALDDRVLNVHRVSSRTSHKLVVPPSPSFGSGPCVPPDEAWEAFYPKSSINPTNKVAGGFSFYLSGPADFRDHLRDASEVIVSYSVMFQSDFGWSKGGKMPGICK